MILFLLYLGTKLLSPQYYSMINDDKKYKSTFIQSETNPSSPLTVTSYERQVTYWLNEMASFL